MKVVVVGAGGVGGYFGARLAASGNDVCFIARGHHLEALKQNGLTLKSIKGNVVLPHVTAMQDIASAGVADLVLFAVKAWQITDEIVEGIKHITNESTTIIPLENGLSAFEMLTAALGEKNVIGGLCRIFSKIESPGVICHFDAEPTIIFGEPSNEKSERVLRIQNAFAEAGVEAIVPNDIAAEVWKKYLFICSSGLLAVARSTYGEIRELPETRAMLKALFEEIYNVAIAHGVSLKPQIVDNTLKFIDTFVYSATSSLTRDVMDGRPSEIEAQNGTIVRLGKKYGIPTPVNEFIYNTILPMENRARGKKL